MLDDPQPTYMVIDRFEDSGWVILEWVDGANLRLPAVLLPRAARPGDVLRVELSSELEATPVRQTVVLTVDPDETRRRRQHAEGLRESLPKGPEADIDL
jgi:hypothetical protein